MELGGSALSDLPPFEIGGEHYLQDDAVLHLTQRWPVEIERQQLS